MNKNPSISCLCFHISCDIFCCLRLILKFVSPSFSSSFKLLQQPLNPMVMLMLMLLVVVVVVVAVYFAVLLDPYETQNKINTMSPYYLRIPFELQVLFIFFFYFLAN